jgi:hypothetical protein
LFAAVAVTAPRTARAESAPGKFDNSFADAILDRWAWEQGKRSQIRLIKSVVIDAAIESSAAPGKTIPYHSVASGDGSFRHESTRPDGTVFIQAYDGKTGWQENETLGFGLIRADDLADLLHWDDVRAPLVVSDAYPYRKVLPGEIRLGDIPTQVVELTPEHGSTERWYFERDSARWRGVSRVATENRPAIALELDDWKIVEKIWFPFRITYSGPGVTMTVRRKTIALNQPVDRAKFSPSPQRMAEAAEIEKILVHHLAAMGGREAVNRIRSSVRKQSVDVLSSGMKYEATLSQKAPGLILLAQNIPGLGWNYQGYDGHIGWGSNEIQGYRELKSAELLQLIYGSSLQLEAELQTVYPMRRLLGAREIDGHPTKAVALATSSTVNGTYYFDDETGRLLRIEGTFGVGADGALSAVINFSDFRTVEGVTLPFVTTLTNPALQVVTKTLSLDVNVPLDDAIFKPKKEE